MTTWNSGSAWNSGGRWGIGDPADPEDLIAETESEHEIRLEWDIVGVVDQTNIYRAEESGGDLDDYEQIASVDDPEDDYTDENLTNGRTYYYRVTTENTVGESGPSNEDSDTTEVPKPEISDFDTSAEREIGVELDPQDNNDDGDITVYRDGEELATVNRATTEYTDTASILDGQQYEYFLERDTGDGMATGPPDTTVSFLPDADSLSLDGTPPSVLEAEWDQVLNNGKFRLEYRDDDPDGDHPDYQLETTIAYDNTPTHSIEGVLDGEQFSARIRTETDHATGEWLSAEEITKLYSADTPTFSAVGETEATLGWINNSEFDGSNQIYRRRLYADDVGQWRLVGTAASDAESATDDSVTPDVEYEYYIRSQTPWIGSDSDTSDSVTTEDIGLSHRAVPPRGWHVEIETDGAFLTPAILSEGTRLEPTLNGQPQATVDVPRDEAYLLEQFEGADMRVYRNGDRRAVDELEDVVIETDRDELIGYGATALEKDVQIDVDDQPTHEMVADLLEEHAPEIARNIDDPDTEISEGVIVADPSETTALEEILGEWPFGDDVPIRIEGNQIELLDTCDIVDLSGSAEDDQYSGGSADDTDPVQSSHSFDYTIPGEHIGLAVREGVLGSDVPDIEFQFNNEAIATLGRSGTDLPEWTDALSGVVPDQDVEAADFGAFEVGAGDDPHIIDCVAVYDQRYHDVEDFSDEVHEPGGYLNRPYRKPPEGVDLETETLAQFRRAVAGALEVETNDPEGLLKLELSADNGRTWLEAEDTDVLEGEFDEAGPYLRARLTLGAIVDEPQDATPRFGHEGQTVESLKIRADFDNTPLMVNHQDEGELGEVLATAAEQSDAVYEIWQDGDETVFEFTHPGQRESSRADAIADYSVTKHNRRVLKCKVKGNNAPVRGEEIDVDGLGEAYSLSEDDVIRGKEAVRGEDGDRLSVGLDYELYGADGEIVILENGSVDVGDTIEIDYDYTVSGSYEHPDYDGDTREKRTEDIPACRSERAAEQAAKVIVDEHSTPRWEAEVSIAYEDVQDIRLSDTLDLEDVPGEAEVVRGIDDEGSESGLSLQLGNQPEVSETVSQIQSTLSSAADLV